MRCNDFNYIRYMDGDYDKKTLQQIQRHIASCAACRKKIRAFDTINYMLKSYSVSVRLRCPSPQNLQGYVDGKLSEETRKRCDIHMATCEACKKTVEKLTSVRGLSQHPGILSAKGGLPRRILGNVRRDLRANVLHRDEVIACVTRFIGAPPMKGIPRGVFLFAGSDGSGKSFLAKQFAKSLYGSRYLEFFIREYMKAYYSSSELFKITGAPGFSDDLITKMAKAGEGIVLLEDIEEAHPAVWKSFYRFFKEGEASNIFGVKVDLSRFVFIMTTSRGYDASILRPKRKPGFQAEQCTPEETLPVESVLVSQFEFDEDFLELFDKIYFIPPIDETLYEKIIERELNNESGRKGIPFVWDTDFIRTLSPCISRKFGSRQIFRTLRKLIFEPIEEFIEENPRQWKSVKRVVMSRQEYSGQKCAAKVIPLRFLALGRNRTAFSSITTALPDADVRRTASMNSCARALKRSDVDMVCIDIDSYARPGKISEAMSAVETIMQQCPGIDVIAASRQEYPERDKQKLLEAGVSLVCDPGRSNEIAQLGNDLTARRKEKLIRYHRGGDVQLSYSEKDKTLHLSFIPL